MRPKCQQTWNDSMSSLIISLKHNQPITIIPLHPNGSYVTDNQPIATYTYDDTQSKRILACTPGYIVWVKDQPQFIMDQLDCFNVIGTIFKNKQDLNQLIEESSKVQYSSNQIQEEIVSTTTSFNKEHAIKLNYSHLGNAFSDKILLVKWKTHVGDVVSTGSTLGYCLDFDGVQQPLISKVRGIVEYLAPIDQQYSMTDLLITVIEKEINCKHLKVEDNKCIYCYQIIKSNQKEEQCFPGWQIDDDMAKRYSTDIITQTACVNKKLILVLDLDQTILHAIKIDAKFNITEYITTTNQKLIEEQMLTDLENEVNSFIKTSMHIKEHLLSMACDSKFKFIIKLRPYFEQFFLKLIPLYDIYIYTKASRSYADYILSYLTKQLYLHIPQHYPYFPANRVFSRDDTNCLNSKSLNRLFYPGIADNLMVILDDNPAMWAKFKGNLVNTRPYYYFQEGTGGKDSQGIANDIENQIRIVNSNDFWLFKITERLVDLSNQFWEQLKQAKLDPSFTIQTVVEFTRPKKKVKVEVTKDNKVVQEERTDLDLIYNRNISVKNIYQSMRQSIMKGICLFFAISQTHSEKVKDGLEQSKSKALGMGARCEYEFKENSFIGQPKCYIITVGRKKIKSIRVAQENQIPIIHYKWIEDCDAYLELLDYKQYEEGEIEVENILQDESERDKKLKRIYFNSVNN